MTFRAGGVQAIPETASHTLATRTRMSYSNPGNAIAGYLIEKASGQPFDLYIRETFLRPLGMEKADFPFTDANKAMLATVMKKIRRGLWISIIYLRPAGDLKASPGELAKLVQFLLRRGRVENATGEANRSCG